MAEDEELNFFFRLTESWILKTTQLLTMSTSTMTNKLNVDAIWILSCSRFESESTRATMRKSLQASTQLQMNLKTAQKCQSVSSTSINEPHRCVIEWRGRKKEKKTYKKSSILCFLLSHYWVSHFIKIDHRWVNHNLRLHLLLYTFLFSELLN